MKYFDKKVKNNLYIDEDSCEIGGFIRTSYSNKQKHFEKRNDGYVSSREKGKKRTQNLKAQRKYKHEV